MPVHCAEQAETVREYCGRSRGGFKPKREVLLKFVVQLKIICVDAISEPWLLILVVNAADVESRWLAHLILHNPPGLRGFCAHPPDVQLPLKAMISNLVDTIGTIADHIAKGPMTPKSLLRLHHHWRNIEDRIAISDPSELQQHGRGRAQALGQHLVRVRFVTFKQDRGGL